MPANVDGMVREGISAYRSGRKEEAQALLLRAVEIDQFNEQAWLWLSAVVETPDEQRTCLENVLTINPSNERARQGLEMLEQKHGSGPKNIEAHADDILANTSFSIPPSNVNASANSESSDDELPTSIEWGSPVTASSSPSSNYKVNEPSSQDYDDWVTKLNIGGSSSDTSSSTLEEANKFMSIAPDDDSQILESESDDDLFSSGPFSIDTPISALPTTEEPIRPQSPLKSASAPSVSPAPTRIEKPTLSSSASVFSDEEELRGGAFLEDGFDDTEMEKLEANEFFQYIPREIPSTRLPGTSEHYPIPILAAVMLLLLINIGALIMLIQNLTSKVG